MFRMMLSGDWELTRDRLPIANPILQFMADEFRTRNCNMFIGTGDYIAEFVPDVTAALRDFAHSLNGHKVFILGNHDYNVPGIDRINAIFGGGLDDIAIKTVPGILSRQPVAAGGRIAFMPAPNRAAFGASRGAENNITRNAALTDALGNAIKSIKMQIPDGELERTVLIGHGTPSGAVFPSGKSSRGLTWEFPAADMADFGLCAFGHIHTPYSMADGKIVGVGGIAPWTHGDHAALYYALIITFDDNGNISHEWMALPRVMFNMEFTVDEHEQINFEYQHDALGTGGIVSESISFGGIDFNDAHAIAHGFDDIIRGRMGWHWNDGDTVALKIRFNMPADRLAALPSNDEIRAAFQPEHVGSFYARNIQITRERTDTAIQSRIAADHKRMKLPELFHEWCVATGRDTDTRGYHIAAAIIENEYTADFGADGHFGIEPLRLRIDNFRQWDAAEIDFADWDGAVAITGKNALGKSNLIESILFALFKRTPSSSGLIADEINVNATDATVEFEFMAGDRHYRVRRALKRTKRGATCKTELFKLTDYPGETTPVAESAADIDREISAIVGSYEFVISTFFGTQKDIDRLIDATPAETHQLMLESMALQRFEPMRERAASLARDSQTAFETAKSRVEILNTGLAADLERIESMRTLTDCDDEIKSETELLNGAKHQRVESAESLVSLQSERVTAMARLKAMDSRRDDMDAIVKTITTIQNEILRREKTAETMAANTPAVHPAYGDAEPIAELEKRQSEMIERRKAMDDELIMLRNEYNEFWRQRETYDAQVKSAVSEIATIQDKIDAIDAAEHPAVPCTDLISDIKPDIECPAYRMMIDAARRESLAAEMENWNRTAIMASDERDRAGDAARAVDDRIIEQRRDYSELVQAINDMEKQISDARRIIAARERYDAEIERIDELRKMIELRHGERDRIERELDAEPQLKSSIDILNEKIKNALEYNNMMDRVIDGHRARIVELERQKAAIETLMETIARYRGQIADEKKNADALSWESLAQTLIAAAFSANGGIPYLIMERMVGSIATETNRILRECGTGIVVEINTVTETQAGDARNRVEIRFTDERGNHPLAAASGFQRAAIGMPLRAAFTRIGSEFWGMMPAFFVQDEGWDRFHASARPIAGALIGELAGISRRFIYITHIDELSEFADVRINVYGENGVSRFNRIA